MVRRIIKAVLLTLLKFYKRFISPILPPLCKYEPTCSIYMMQAIEQKGIIKGLLLGTWRLIRCNPFSKGGWDPVDPEDKPTYLNRTGCDAPCMKGDE